ncbi:hypothetical protein [Dysgonomonas massiliensis]|nr:hypothetical protein [Dysgonomonas massiliensis]
MADNTKTFKIKIDGLEQSVQYTKSQLSGVGFFVSLIKLFCG